MENPAQVIIKAVDSLDPIDQPYILPPFPPGSKHSKSYIAFIVEYAARLSIPVFLIEEAPDEKTKKERRAALEQIFAEFHSEKLLRKALSIREIPATGVLEIFEEAKNDFDASWIIVMRCLLGAYTRDPNVLNEDILESICAGITKKTLEAAGVDITK